MNLNEFHEQLAAAPLSFRSKLRDYLRHPTERNACYITGYVVALKDMCLFKTEDATSYWLTLIGRAERNFAMSGSLLAAMDNLSEASTTLEEADDHALLTMEEREPRDETLLRQALAALEQIATDLPWELTGLQADTIAALRERLGGKT